MFQLQNMVIDPLSSRRCVINHKMARKSLRTRQSKADACSKGGFDMGILHLRNSKQGEHCQSKKYLMASGLNRDNGIDSKLVHLLKIYILSVLV